MNCIRIAAIALVSVLGLSATPINYGTAGYRVTAGGVTRAGSVVETTPEGSFSFGNIVTHGYTLLVSWDIDPTLTWSFITTQSGLHTIQFYMGFPTGRFNEIFTSAGYTITGQRRGAGATVSDLTLKPYTPLPIAAKNYVPQGAVTVKGVKGVKGTLTRSNDNSNSGGTGDYVAMPIRTANGMGVEITFNTTLAAGDRFAMNGTMSINPVVPEPATVSLLGAALVGLLAAARRKALLQ